MQPFIYYEKGERGPGWGLSRYLKPHWQLLSLENPERGHIKGGARIRALYFSQSDLCDIKTTMKVSMYLLYLKSLDILYNRELRSATVLLCNVSFNCEENAITSRFHHLFYNSSRTVMRNFIGSTLCSRLTPLAAIEEFIRLKLEKVLCRIPTLFISHVCGLITYELHYGAGIY